MSRRHPSGALRGGDEDELGPLRVSIADVHVLTDANPKGSSIWNLVRGRRHHTAHRTIIGHCSAAAQGGVPRRARLVSRSAVCQRVTAQSWRV